VSFFRGGEGKRLARKSVLVQAKEIGKKEVPKKRRGERFGREGNRVKFVRQNHRASMERKERGDMAA